MHVVIQIYLPSDSFCHSLKLSLQKMWYFGFCQRKGRAEGGGKMCTCVVGYQVVITLVDLPALPLPDQAVLMAAFFLVCTSPRKCSGQEQSVKAVGSIMNSRDVNASFPQLECEP